jgi:hypothetical protein
MDSRKLFRSKEYRNFCTYFEKEFVHIGAILSPERVEI